MVRYVLALFCILPIVQCSGTETDNPSGPSSGDDASSGNNDAGKNIDFIRSKEAYLKSEKSPAADQQSLQKGNLAFTLDLYREVAKEASAEENLFISPYSVSTLMAMTYAGARGNTQSQMSAALHFDLDQSALHPAMNNLAQRLAAIGEKEKSFVFQPRNSIWMQQDYEVLDSFLDILSQHYDAGVYLADFAGAPEEARKSINQWISEETTGYIPELFPKGSIDSLSRLALTNTVYLSALWEYPFDEQSTEDGKFTLFSGKQVTLPMMSYEIWFPFYFHTDWRAVALPYKGTHVSMICVLPNPGEFEQFEQAFDTTRVEQIVDLVSPSETRDYPMLWLTIPKFSFDSGTDLKQTLSSLGMTDAFDEVKANFSGINDEGLSISTALQKTHIAIDEKGTVAVAASGEAMWPAAVSPSLHLNRPFLFFIWDDDTKTVLFIGRLVHPQGPVSEPTNVEPTPSDAETICNALGDPSGECQGRTLTKQQCLDSLANDDPAVLEQCADCYSALFDGCGYITCFCGQPVCVSECPSHPF